MRTKRAIRYGITLYKGADGVASVTFLTLTAAKRAGDLSKSVNVLLHVPPSRCYLVPTRGVIVIDLRSTSESPEARDEAVQALQIIEDHHDAIATAAERYHTTQRPVRWTIAAHTDHGCFAAVSANEPNPYRPERPSRRGQNPGDDTHGMEPSEDLG